MIQQMENVVEYIRENIVAIDPMNEKLDTVFNISRSHLDRCFKNHTGTTIKRYIKLEKIRKAVKYVLNVPEMTILEINEKINWGCDRTLRTKFKENTGHSASEIKKNRIYFDMGTPKMKNKVLLNELMFRYLLLKGYDKNIVNHHTHSKLLLVDISNTLIQPDIFYGLKEMGFVIYYNVSTDTLNLFFINESIHEKGKGLIFDKYYLYINMINGMDYHLNEDLDMQMSDSIRNWDFIVSELKRGEEIGIDFILNPDSEFMKQTDLLIGLFKKQFRKNHSDFIYKEYGIQLDDLIELCDYILKEPNEDLEPIICRIVNGHDKRKNIRLLLTLVDCPVVDDIFNNNLDLEVHDEIIDGVMQKDSTEMLDFIKKFLFLKDKVEEDDDFGFEDYDNCLNKLLNSIL